MVELDCGRDGDVVELDCGRDGDGGDLGDVDGVGGETAMGADLTQVLFRGGVGKCCFLLGGEVDPARSGAAARGSTGSVLDRERLGRETSRSGVAARGNRPRPARVDRLRLRAGNRPRRARDLGDRGRRAFT